MRPEPPQCGQGLGLVPTLAPEPEQASQDTVVGNIMNLKGYLAVPGAGAGGGIRCLDYNDLKSTSAPAVNFPGPGNEALPGCAGQAGTPGANVNVPDVLR